MCILSVYISYVWCVQCRFWGRAWFQWRIWQRLGWTWRWSQERCNTLFAMSQFLMQIIRCIEACWLHDIQSKSIPSGGPIGTIARAKWCMISWKHILWALSIVTRPLYCLSSVITTTNCCIHNPFKLFLLKIQSSRNLLSCVVKWKDLGC